MVLSGLREWRLFINVMKKKKIILSSIYLTIGLVASVLPFASKTNLFVKAESDEDSHQIVFTAENTSVEKEDTYTKFFTLHKDDATLSGYSIDSTPGECHIAADGDRNAGGDHICYAEVNPQSGSSISFVLSIPLSGIKSFTSVVLRGSFYQSFWADKVDVIEFGSECYSDISNKLEVHVAKPYKVFFLDEIEINYTCAA